MKMHVTAVFTQRLGQFDHLKARLRALQIPCVEQPMYELLAPPNWDAADKALLHRDQYDGFIFISPFAISQTVNRWQQQIQTGILRLNNDVDQPSASNESGRVLHPNSLEVFDSKLSLLWPNNFPPLAVMGERSREALIQAGLANQIILTPSNDDYKKNDLLKATKYNQSNSLSNNSNTISPFSLPSLSQIKETQNCSCPNQFTHDTSRYNINCFESNLKTVNNNSGSELLWPVISQFYGGPEQLSGKRFALFRSEQGREWLTQQLIANGANIESITVYRRQILNWSNELWKQTQLMLGKAKTNNQYVWLITSTEMLRHLVTKIGHSGNDNQQISFLNNQLRATPIIVTHKRIADVARQQCFETVKFCESNDQAIMNAFLEMTFT